MRNIVITFLFGIVCAVSAYGQCVISCPANITVPCTHAVGSIIPSITADCGAITLQRYTITGATTASSPLTGIHDASAVNFLSGVSTVTYYVEVSSGASSTCSFTVTNTDTSAPIVICPPDVTFSNDTGECFAIVNNGFTHPKRLGFPNSADNCSGITTVANGIPPNSEFPVGTTEITWTVTDLAGNSVNCTQFVTITDDEAPTINCPSDITVNTDPGQCNAYVNVPMAIASDNCSITSIVNNSIYADANGADASGTYPVGTTIIQFTATASDNRTISCSMDITVMNTQVPILNLNGSSSITIEACDTYTELGATATDPCAGDISGDIVIDSSSLPNTNVPGTYTITYNVANENGIAATELIRTVIIEDITAPTLMLVGPSILTIGDCSTYTELGATIDDGCVVNDPSNQIIIDNSAVNSGVLGSYVVTYNFTDDSGNSAAQITRTVNVVDVNEPIITLTGDNPQTIEACTPYIELGATAIDPCSGDVLTNIVIVPPTPAELSTPGSYTVTYNVTDTVGIAAEEVIRTIIVEDNSIPNVICQNISVQLDPITGLVTIYPEDIDNGTTDNCSVSLSLSQTSFDCSNLGDNIVTLTAADPTGNSSSCDATVTITDLAETSSVGITSDTSLICTGESVTFTANPTDGGSNPQYQWQINTSDVMGETDPTFSTNSLVDGDTVTVIMTSDLSVCALPKVSNGITVNVITPNADADAGLNFTNTVCTATTVNLSANPITEAGSNGNWTVISGQTSGFSFSDTTSHTSTFTGDIGETYELLWTVDNPEPCADSSDSMFVTYIGCNALDFDGVDDNVTFRDNFNLSGPFSFEIWLKSEVTNTNIQTILSKREATDFSTGYDLRLTNSILSFHWDTTGSISSPYSINLEQWHHVAVTFNGSSYTLYIDGVEVNSSNGSIPTTNTNEFILGAMDESITAPFSPQNYFNGGMDEFRIWNVALSEDQIRKMMNQEVKATNVSNTIDGNVNGSEIPLEINGLSWNDLLGYYQMNQNVDILNGALLNNNSNNINGVLRFMTTFQPETAPIPYLSNDNGGWDAANTWLFGDTQTIPNSIGIDGTTEITWNIVKTTHNVSSGNRNIKLGSLLVEDNTLTIGNTDPLDGQSLSVSNYLIINGTDSTLDLEGESQLIQGVNSIYDYNGSGKLHRDQQGTSNLFNYNYWGSPVSTDGSQFSIGNVLNDQGQLVQWTNSNNAIGTTSPVTLSNRWLYLYENYIEFSYADWNRINENYAINVGLGFLMKGSGSSSDSQNYTFKGKPNNGTFLSPITLYNQALLGNPYPSAIDANAFIIDNAGSIQGSLYYWEHYTSNSTHILEDYEGGYAVYNLTGGIPAVAPFGISTEGSPSKIPERYIPVGQGFFVVSNSTGGNIEFNNSQRVFVKEAVTGAANNGSVFMRNSVKRDVDEESTIQRMRLNFKSNDNLIRTLLLGFTENNAATDNFDFGYDAVNTESFSSDMSWLINEIPYVIQGVGEFDNSKIYPLEIYVNGQSNIEITLNGLENFENDIEVFVFDAFKREYTSIIDNSFIAFLDEGYYSDRFFITFSQQHSLSTTTSNLQDIVGTYLIESEEIYINHPNISSINSIELVNMLGQEVYSWRTNDFYSTSNGIRIDSKFIAEGAYILRVQNNEGYFNTKIIVSH